MLSNLCHSSHPDLDSIQSFLCSFNIPFQHYPYFCSVLKLLTSIFTVIYLALSLNLSLNFHYCFGDLKDVSFFSENVESCCERFQADPPCCDFQKLDLEINGFQLPMEKLMVQFLPLQFIQQFGEVVSFVPSISETILQFSDSSPPLIREMLIFFRGLLFYE